MGEPREIEQLVQAAKEITGQVNGRQPAHKLSEEFHEHLIGKLAEAVEAFERA